MKAPVRYELAVAPGDRAVHQRLHFRAANLKLNSRLPPMSDLTYTAQDHQSGKNLRCHVARCNRSCDTIGKKHHGRGTLRALPRPSAALGRARPPYSSSPAPLTPRPRARRTCAATAAPLSPAVPHEVMRLCSFIS